MGKRKCRAIIIGFLCIFFQTLFSSCIRYRGIDISGFSIESATIKMELDCKHYFPSIRDVWFESDDCHLFFGDEDISIKKYEDKMEILLNFSGKSIKTNQEYEVLMHFSGGYAYANIFFENPVKEVGEFYPCENYEDIRIAILKKGYAIGI